jgi:hypothetical protein
MECTRVSTVVEAVHLFKYVSKDDIGHKARDQVDIIYKDCDRAAVRTCYLEGY